MIKTNPSYVPAYLLRDFTIEEHFPLVLLWCQPTISLPKPEEIPSHERSVPCGYVRWREDLI